MSTITSLTCSMSMCFYCVFVHQCGLFIACCSLSLPDPGVLHLISQDALTQTQQTHHSFLLQWSSFQHVHMFCVTLCALPVIPASQRLPSLHRSHQVLQPQWEHGPYCSSNNNTERVQRYASQYSGMPSTLILCGFSVGDEATLSFICNRTAAPYFSNLVWFIGKHVLELDDCVRTDAE